VYDVVLSPRSTPALQDGLPSGVAGAVIELLHGPLRTAPHAVGKPLGAPFLGCLAVRRGEYRVLYQVDDDAKRVTVERIVHRRDAYRGVRNGR
jgi:mRNA-degrading endonuclease RelE of RelBE toxin-antitoxin system